MVETKPCVNCGRAIDIAARLCPFCNWDQSDTPPRAELPEPAAAPAASAAGQKTTGADDPQQPPEDSPGRTIALRTLLAAAVVAVLIATFAVGALVYSFGKRTEEAGGPEIAQNAPVTTASPRGERSFPDLTLVPEGDPTATIGRAVTSAPIPDPDHKLPEEAQRDDATALPSEEYARILEERRAEQEREREKERVVDPRTIRAQPTPSPEERAARRRQQEQREQAQATRQPPAEAQAQRTRPVPIRQPLPSFEEVGREGTVRLNLTVSPEGRVTQIDVIRSAPGITDKMIAAVQKWRFKPATLNGEAVEGKFLVDVSFTGND